MLSFLLPGCLQRPASAPVCRRRAISRLNSATWDVDGDRWMKILYGWSAYLGVFLFCGLGDLVKPCSHICQGLLKGRDNVGVCGQLGGEVDHLRMGRIIMMMVRLTTLLCSSTSSFWSFRMSAAVRSSWLE